MSFDLQTQLAVQRLVHLTWWDTDADSGAHAERFFAEDAVVAMPARTMKGREQILQGYKARIARGPRLSRHLVQNLIVEQDGDKAIARYALLLFAANGTAPMQVAGYQAIADVTDKCILLNGDWVIHHRALVSIFIAPDHDSIMLLSPGVAPSAT